MHMFYYIHQNHIMHKLLTLLLLWPFTSSTAQTAKSFRGSQVDTFFGHAVADPYRSLEETDNVDVKKWMKEEADKTSNFLASLPGRQTIFDEINAAYNGTPIDEINTVQYWKGKYYVTKRKTGQENYSLYEIDSMGNEKLFLDPVTAHPEINSKNIMLAYFNIFQKQSQLLYMLTIGGKESEPKMGLRNLETGKEIWDTAYFNMNKSLDFFDPERDDAFYYDDMPLFKKPGVDMMHWYDSATIKYHVNGARPEDDKMIIDYNPSIINHEINATVMLTAERNLDYAFAVVKNKVANEYRIYVTPRGNLHNTTIPWTQLTDFSDKVSQYVMCGHFIYLLTSKDADNSKVLRVDLREPLLKNAVELIANSKVILTKIAVTKNDLLVSALDAGQGKLFKIKHGSKVIETIATPLQGVIDFTWSDRDQRSFIVSITSWTKPLQYFSYNTFTRKLVHSVIQKNTSTEIAPLEVQEVFVKSHDGVEVPMTIICKKGLKMDVTHPLMLMGYGAYGMQDDPYFWPEGMVWYNNGGIRAFAHVRGGGVYGEEWHKAGQKSTKPNTWKDFIACAEYLVDNKWTSNKTLIAVGGSAGGITVGRAITERPELFAAAMIGVGALDMVRFETTPNGRGNIPEFGSVKTEEGFKSLYEMSAYHHVKNGVHYPFVVLQHGVNDTRVPVWTSLKMAARLQESSTSPDHVLLQLNYDSGHGAQKTISQILNETADNYSFCFWLVNQGATSK